MRMCECMVEKREWKKGREGEEVTCMCIWIWERAEHEDL